MFGFGSCGSWSISVRFGVWNILQWYLFFFRRRNSKYRLLPARGLLLPARGFMSSGFQRAERAELGKPKLPEIVSACNLLWRNPYLFFSLNSKSNYNFSNQFFWGRVRRFRFLRFGFAHGSSGSRFLRFIGYLIFYGSVPRFRFGSRTLLTIVNLHSRFQMTKCLLSKALMVFATYAQETQFMQYSQSNGIGWEFAGRTGRNLQHCEEDRDGFPLAGVEVEVFFQMSGPHLRRVRNVFIR